jgi:hypothetical protein
MIEKQAIERENGRQPGITEQTESSDWTIWVFRAGREANGFSLERSEFAYVSFLRAFQSVPLFPVAFISIR